MTNVMAIAVATATAAAATSAASAASAASTSASAAAAQPPAISHPSLHAFASRLFAPLTLCLQVSMESSALERHMRHESSVCCSLTK
jgi:hypothetical protein